MRPRPEIRPSASYTTVAPSLADNRSTARSPVTGAARTGHINTTGLRPWRECHLLGHDGFYVDGIGQCQPSIIATCPTNRAAIIKSGLGTDLEVGSASIWDRGWSVVPQCSIELGRRHFRPASPTLSTEPATSWQCDSAGFGHGVRVEKLVR